MAENKKSFVLYADLINTVRKMPKEKAGELFLTILSYVNDENPVVDDIVVDLVFEPIKQQLKRDLVKWDEIREKRSGAGKASADKRKHEATKATSVESVEQSSTNPTVSVTVNDTVNVNDTVSVINNTPKNNFESVKEVFSKKYSEQNDFFKKEHTEKEYVNFQNFLNAMFRDFTIESLLSQWDRCIGIGDWKKHLKSKGFMVLKPAIEKAIAAKEGNREQMALRIKTFTNGQLDDKVMQL